MRLSPVLHALTTVATLVQARTLRRSTVLVPSQDPFYLVPEDISDAIPGEILGHRDPPSPYEAYRWKPSIIEKSYQLLYRTSDNIDNATATVLTVLVPKNANMSRVISYQVAEDAASIDCAPSFGFLSAVASHKLLDSATMQLQLLIVQSALERGWVVIVPDFQGPMALYAANRMAGNAVLDGIRAALQSEDITGIDPEAKVVLWGYSGGATVSQHAAEMQPLHAPELKLAGAAIGGIGPPDDSLDSVLSFNKNRRTGLLVSAWVGLGRQYPELKKLLDEQLDPEYKKTFYKPLHQCLEANLDTFYEKDVLGKFKDLTPLLTSPVVRQIGDDNSRGTTTSKTPMLWYQATRDEIADIADIDELYEAACAEGAVIDYIRDTAPNLAHRNYGVVGAPAALAWIQDRFEDKGEERECSIKTYNTPNADPDFLGLFPANITQSLLELVRNPPTK